MRQMDQGAGRTKVALAKGIGHLWPEQFARISEADYGTHRYAGVTDRVSRIADSDIVDLWAYSQVGQDSYINATADAVGKIGG